MKINKLFHWLYGALMCLPLLGVLFTSLYVTFNPNSKDSFSGNEEYTYNTINYLYETNEVDNTDDLSTFNSIVEGNIYKVSWNFTWSSEVVTSTLISFSDDYSNKYSYIDFDTTALSYNVNGNEALAGGRYSVTFTLSRNISTSILACSATQRSFSVIANGGNSQGVYNLYIVILRKQFLNVDNSKFTISSCPNEKIPYIVEQVVHEEDTLDNAFTYAINDINNNPLYNWAQNSFLVAPIAFVTGLFGLTQTSPVVTLLSYWLTISIVWLVFDLIMYIPLLVHRWLDKGVLS